MRKGAPRSWKALAASLLFALLLPGVVRAQATIQFTVRFVDPKGYDDIERVTLAMGSARCQVEVYPSTSQMDLLDGPSGVRGTMASLGSDETLANDECSVSAAGSSVAGSGDQLRVGVRVTLATVLPGSRPFTASAVSAGGGPTLAPISTWIDPSPGGSKKQEAPLTPADGVTCSYAFPAWTTGFYYGPYSVMEIWTAAPGCQGAATSSVDWLTVGAPGVAGA